MTDKKSEDPSKIFTYDPESEGESEAPSLTRLLNRKSLTQKKPTGPSSSGTQTKTPIPSEPPSPPQGPPAFTPSQPQATEKKDPTSIAIELSDPSSPEPTPLPQSPSEAQDIALPPSSLDEGGIEIEGLELQPVKTEIEAQASPSQNTPEDNQKTSTPHDSLSLQSEAQPQQHESPAPQTPTIRKAPKPSAHPQSPEIKTWDLQHLSQNPDPLGKAIIEMLQRGADCALFLAITPPEGSSSAPFFRAAAGINSEKRIPLWRGIQWKPELFKDLWNAFLKSGQIELGPTPSPSVPEPAKNAMRAALGTLPSEWLILVRVGSPQSCRGVIAFFSKQSLLSELAHVLPLLNSDLPK